MSEQEKLQTIPQLKEEGNSRFKAREYAEAAKLYAKAIGMLEQLMNK